MFKEIFDVWKNEVLTAVGPRVATFDPQQNRIVTLPGGKTEVIEAKPANRTHQVFDLDSLAALTRNVAIESGSAWFSRAGITAILDDAGLRKDCATMALALSPQLKKLMELETNRTTLKQADIVGLMRINFKDCGLETVIAMLRQVKFSVNQEGQAEIQRGKVSVGNSHLAEFHGLANLPESVLFPVPIFESRFLWVEPINVAIDPDPASQTFRLIPYPGQIEQAIAKGEAKLGEKLREIMPENVAVYFGKP